MHFTANYAVLESFFCAFLRSHSPAQNRFDEIKETSKKINTFSYSVIFHYIRTPHFKIMYLIIKSL